MSFKIRVCSAVAALLIFCLLLSACRMSDIQDGEEDNAPVGDPSAALPDPDEPAYEQQLAVACASVLPFCRSRTSASARTPLSARTWVGSVLICVRLGESAVQPWPSIPSR